MKLSYFRTQVAALSLVALLLVGVTPSPASAAVLPTLGTRLYWILGSLLNGGMVATANASLDTTSIAASVTVIPEFASATTLKTVNNSTANAFPYEAEFIAYVRSNTGSASYRYGAACFINPFKNMGGGSGVVLHLEYSPQFNPAAVGGDIGFVKDCTNHDVTDDTASGSDLIDNVCTASGCVSQYTTGTANWNGADYIKFSPRANLTSGYAGRITGKVVNIWGE